MQIEISVIIYMLAVFGFVAWNIKKGSFVFDPSKLVPVLIFIAVLSVAIIASMGIDLGVATTTIMKIGAAGILFSGTLPMVAAGIGLLRFGDEYGVNIFYVRNHIGGIVDCVSSLVMIFVGLLIVRLDLAAVGFFFFMLLPFTSNALANSYYYAYQGRSNN